MNKYLLTIYVFGDEKMEVIAIDEWEAIKIAQAVFRFKYKDTGKAFQVSLVKEVKEDGKGIFKLTE